MKVKELADIIFSQQPVKIVSCSQPKFIGRAYELEDCEFKDREIMEIYVGTIDKGMLCIEITHKGG